MLDARIGYIAIEAGTDEDLEQLFDKLKVKSSVIESIKNYEAIKPMLNAYVIHKDIDKEAVQHIVWQQNGWLVLEDFSYDFYLQIEELKQLAIQLFKPIFSIYVEEDSYYFCYYTPTRERLFEFHLEKVQEDIGDPIEAEEGWSFDEYTKAVDVINLGKRLGIDIQKLKKLPEYSVYTLESTEERKVASLESTKATDELLAIYSSPKDNIPTKKKWWQIWK